MATATQQNPDKYFDEGNLCEKLAMEENGLLPIPVGCKKVVACQLLAIEKILATANNFAKRLIGNHIGCTATLIAIL